MAISPILSSTPVSSVSSNNKSSSSSHSMITGRKLFLIVLALVVVGHFTLMYIYKRHSEKNFLSQLDDNFAHADERTHLQMPFRTTNAIVENNDHNNNNNNNINKNNQEAANPKKTREEQAQITRHENWKQLIAQEEAELSKKIEELKALKEQEQSELQTLKEEKNRISADNKAAQATTTTTLTPLSTPDAPTTVVAAVPVLTGINAIMSAEDAHAVETGVSLQTQPPLESNSIIMPSSNDEIQTKQLFVIPVYDQQSMDEAAKFAVCLQNFMSTKTYEEQSEIIPIIYTIDIDRKHMKEMENWRYFDLVNLPMDRIISNALSASPMNKRVIQQYILRHLYKRFRITKKKKTELIVFPYRVANKKDLFDLPAIGSLLNIESQCAGPIMQKKFALVVPFPRVQIAEVLEQLKRWGHHKPCVGRPKIYGEKTDLIFYYHTTKFPHLEDIILRQLSSNGKSNGPLRSELYCFNPKITFRYTNLLPEEDSYPSSANRMFYRLMFDNTVYTQYRYHFYAEPDTFPIRDGWLTRILDQAYVPDTPWWVSGSIYRGKVAFANRDGKSQDDPTGGDLGSLEMNIHVNGNALYSFSSDFREFVTMMLNDNYDYAAYDLAFTQFLFRYGWRLTRKVWHHFLFSDFILNMWKTDWTEQQIIWDSPNTYLVHSKQIKEDAFKKKEAAVPAQKQPETVP